MGGINGSNHCASTFGALDKVLSRPSEKLRISVTGAAGLMGSAICRLLKIKGFYVIASDHTKNEHMAEDEFCDDYHVVELGAMDNCLEVTRGVDYVFNFATSTGGLGFSESNPSVITCNSTTIGNNILEAARINGVQRLWHASIVFTYLGANVSLDAWLAEPQYPNGFEKLETEGLCKLYYKDFGMEYRIGRFYCIYGPSRTWEGGKGKAPAAFRGEASTSTNKFEMCGDGLQTRIRKYAEDVLRVMESDSREPVFIGILYLRELVNIESDEIGIENDTAEMRLGFEDMKLPIHHHNFGPEGGRNSDNTLTEEKLGCVEVLKDWLRMMCFWIKEPIEKVKARGIDSSNDGSSEMVGTEAPVDELGSLRTADGKE